MSAVDAPTTASRRVGVLESALRTFVRHGYRRTSMERIALDARISRPGLYLYFASKPALLREAVAHALARDAIAAEAALAATERPAVARLLDALETWAGPYVGPLAADLDELLDEDPALLSDLREQYSTRFRAALERALAEAGDPEVRAVAPDAAAVSVVAEVVLALVAGTKRQAADRADFRERLGRGLVLLLRPGGPAAGPRP